MSILIFGIMFVGGFIGLLMTVAGAAAKAVVKEIRRND